MLSCALAGSIDGSFVICLGSDGHVSFERANDGCCGAGREAGGQSLNREVGTDGSHARVASELTGKCGRCIDFPLISESSAKLGASKLNLPNLAVIPQIAETTDLIFSTLRMTQIRSCDTDDRTDTVLTHQRTVVLHC